MDINVENDMVILPGLNDQAKFVAMQRAKELASAVSELCQQEAINIPLTLDGKPISENDYPKSHLLEKEKGWEPPHPELVRAYFEQLKAYDSKYSENGIAELLDLSSGRAVRNFKSGERPVPYAVWRKFLVATGRAPIEIPKMIGFFK